MKKMKKTAIIIIIMAIMKMASEICEISMAQRNEISNNEKQRK
jgi:hypothetical protein